MYVCEEMRVFNKTNTHEPIKQVKSYNIMSSSTQQQSAFLYTFVINLCKSTLLLKLAGFRPLYNYKVWSFFLVVQYYVFMLLIWKPVFHSFLLFIAASEPKA